MLFKFPWQRYLDNQNRATTKPLSKHVTSFVLSISFDHLFPLLHHKDECLFSVGKRVIKLRFSKSSAFFHKQVKKRKVYPNMLWYQNRPVFNYSSAYFYLNYLRPSSNFRTSSQFDCILDFLYHKWWHTPKHPIRFLQTGQNGNR